jgi:hypothetical protein
MGVRCLIYSQEDDLIMSSVIIKNFVISSVQFNLFYDRAEYFSLV